MDKYLMNESELLQLIATGECKYIDFKRELNLKEPRQKAEFIKDVIALANSAKTNGYLLIGIDDDKLINGIESLQEEQIQQVVQTYITPNVLVSVHLVSIKDAGFKTVGAIKITPTKKPHYVARAIERLNKDDSFVRRGSTTSTLSHHDLAIILDTSGKLKSESKEYSNAGEKHFSLGNYLTAIKAFSKAIELTPESELFFRRAIAYQNYMTERVEKDGPPIMIEDELKELNNLKNKDFNDAIALAKVPEFELKVRRTRYSSSNKFGLSEKLSYTKEQRYEDFICIKESLSGSERAEWVIEQIYEFEIEWDERVLKELEDLINTGYQTSRLFKLIIEMHTDVLFNYGIALKKVDEALDKFRDEEDLITGFLFNKIELLLNMKKYDEAIKVINKLQRMGENPHVSVDEEDLLIRIALREGIEFRDIPTEAALATILMLSFSREPLIGPGLDENRNVVTIYGGNKLAQLGRKIPRLIDMLKDLINEDDFRAIIYEHEDYDAVFRFPGIDTSGFYIP